MTKPERPKPKAMGPGEPPSDFAMDATEHVFLLLYQVSRHRNMRLEEALAPFNLTIAHWLPLAAIRRVEECSMSDLSRLTAIDRTTLTRSVDHLVATGLVDRHVPPRDRRRVTLSLTETGLAVQARALGRVRAANLAGIATVPQERRSDLVRLLEDLLRGQVAEPSLADDVIDFINKVRAP
jgi:DNA-binding MarR family transcriptional regulator